jgi:hypothetical protein
MSGSERFKRLAVKAGGEPRGAFSFPKSVPVAWPDLESLCDPKQVKPRRKMPITGARKIRRRLSPPTGRGSAT